MESKRDFYIDFLRGLAAINIIIIHTAFWSGEQYTPKLVKSITLLLDVPFFFFLAGWSFSYVKSGIKAIIGLIRLQERYLFFLVIYTAILFILNREETSFINFINEFFFKQAIPSKVLPVVMGSIWFLPIYFAVSSIFSIIISIIKRQKDDSILLLYVLLISFLGFIYTQLGYNFFYLSREVLFYGFFYVLGYISKNYRIASWKSLSVILILIVISIILGGRIFGVDITVVQSLKFPPHIIYLLMSMIAISISIYAKNKIIFNEKNYIVKIGQKAIFYYFGQGISSSLIYFLVGIINLQWYLKFLVCVFINISLAIIISEFLSKIYNLFDDITHKFTSKYFGKINSFLFIRN